MDIALVGSSSVHESGPIHLFYQFAPVIMWVRMNESFSYIVPFPISSRCFTAQWHILYFIAPLGRVMFHDENVSKGKIKTKCKVTWPSRIRLFLAAGLSDNICVPIFLRCASNAGPLHGRHQGMYCSDSREHEFI